jgi:hypothetical protein
MDMGAGVGEEEKEEKLFGRPPPRVYKGREVRRDRAVGRTVRPAAGRSGARSSFAGQTAERLASFENRHGNSSRRDVTCINEKNMVCGRNQRPTNLFARNST